MTSASVSPEVLAEVARRVACPACGATAGPCRSIRAGAAYVNGYQHTPRLERARVIIRLVVEDLERGHPLLPSQLRRGGGHPDE